MEATEQKFDLFLELHDRATQEFSTESKQSRESPRNIIDSLAGP